MSRVLSVAVTLIFGMLVSTGETQIRSVAPAVPPPPPPQGAATGVPPRDAVPRTGSSHISGRVTDASTGRPIRRAAVRLSGPIGQPRMTSTDADGRYEFANLPAGSYQVNASKANYVAINYGQTRPQETMRPFRLDDKQVLDRIDFALPRGGVISGRVIDEFGEPVTDVMVSPVRNQYSGSAGRRPMMSGRSATTNDIGEFRLYGLAPGDYYVTATFRMVPGGFESSDDRSGYSPTYFPSATRMSEAQPIRISVGQNVSDVTIVLSPTRTATLTGIALDADGQQIQNGSVTLMARGQSSLPMMSSGGPIRNGTFTVNGVVPGQYVLRATGQPAVNTAGIATVSGTVIAGVTGAVVVNPGLRSQSVAYVDVNGDDISGIVLMPQRPATISGRFVGDAAALASVRPGTTRVNAQQIASDEQFVIGPVAPPNPVAEDLTFSIQVSPGRVLIRPTGMAATLKAVYYQGIDVTDQPIELKDGAELRDVEIELTTRFQTVSGMVTDARGATPTSFSVILFATDSAKWTAPTRFVAVGRPDDKGRYTTRLPPGEYYASAVDYVEPGQWTDVAYLESLRGSATRFSLGEGETRTLDLRMSTTP